MSDVTLRSYERVFTGTNQEGGYIDPVLEFSADTIEQKLKSDKVTYFHFPTTAEQTPLSSAGFIRAGANPGPTPYEADRIWKKTANYKKYTNWGNSNSTQTGVWLCSWLSAGYVGQQPQWMDRWYNPGYITSTTAYYTISTGVYDEPSKMTMDPGVLYRYFHGGASHNTVLVNSLTGAVSSLKIHITDWSVVSALGIDSSGFQNNAYLEADCSVNSIGVYSPYTPKDCLSTNNSGYGRIVYDSTTAPTDEISVMSWIKTDWQSPHNSSMISNGFRGGWDLTLTDGLDAPISTIASTQISAVFINNNGKVFVSKSVNNSVVTDCQYTQDRFTWMLDINNKKVYKTDFNGTITNNIVLGSTTQPTRIRLDRDESLWVLDVSLSGSSVGYSSLSGFNSEGVLVSSRAVTQCSVFDFDLNNQLVTDYGDNIRIDNYNTKWVVVSGSLTKDGVVVDDRDVRSLECDRLDNVWYVYDTNKYCGINSITLEPVLSGQVGVELNTVGVSREHTTQSKDFIWLTDSVGQAVYKLDYSGDVIKTILLDDFNITPSSKTVNRYDWARKFEYLANNRTSTVNASLATTGDTITLKYPVTGLSDKGWHHFAIDYDGSVMTFYIDATVVGTHVLTGDIDYAYEGATFIGCTPGRAENLNTELLTTQYRMVGSWDDIRLYSISLTQYDLWRICMLQFPFEDLSWNMPTGSQPYLEEIESFFKFSLPGSKSQYYNIKLIGLQITDPDVRYMIEKIIRNTVIKISPAHAELYRIIWD